MPQDFSPKPTDSIALFGHEYVVPPHPQMPSMAYRQKAGRARVYQLRNDQLAQYFALKQFKKLYRKPTLIDSYRNLHRVEDFDGLRVARRRIVLPTDPAAQRHPNLQYAMLMPWIHGTTWFDVLGQAREDGDYPDLTTAIGLCDRFLEVMEGLEEAGMTHTDISPGNVMVGFDPIDVQLLDLEDMYMPGASTPPEQNTGSTGYSHRGGETTWRAEGDRYAAAVLAAEMLILADRDLAGRATDEGFFTNHCHTPEGMSRFQQARPWLEKVAPEFARVFERSWYADTLEGCPTISELRAPIKKLSNRPLAPEGPKGAETPISRQPSTESKVALGTTETPVAPTKAPKRLIYAGLAVVALLALAVGVGVWSTFNKDTTPAAAASGGGTETALVPDVVGKSQREAEQTLRLAGFEVEAQRREDSSGDAGEVVEQSPSGGGEVEEGARVEIVVAEGTPPEEEPEPEPADFTLTSTLTGHPDDVMSVAFSPDGALLVSGSHDGTVKVWNPRSGEERTLTEHSAAVSSVAFSPDGGLHWINRPVAFAPDGSFLARGELATVKVLDPQSEEEIRTLTGHSDVVMSVAFSPDGHLLASGSYDSKVKVWDPRSGEDLQTLTGHSAAVSSVVFSPDGALLASGSGDKTIKLWDPRSGEEIRTLTGHSDVVFSAAFSPDGRLLASGGGDDTIKLWDPRSGEEIRTLAGHSGSVFSVAFSPDGSLLASGGADGTVRIWERQDG